MLKLSYAKETFSGKYYLSTPKDKTKQIENSKRVISRPPLTYTISKYLSLPVFAPTQCYQGEFQCKVLSVKECLWLYLT